jgi:vitamin B12 transporter
VVNIITTTPTEPFEADGTVEGGSRDTADVRAGAGGASDKLIWRMAGRYYRTDGISSFVNGPEKDGYRNTGFSGRLKYSFTDAVSIEARSIYSRGRNQFDGFPAPAFTFADTREYGITKELIAYGGLNVDLMDGRFKNRFAFGYTDTNRDNLNPDQRNTTVTFDAAGENKRLEYQGSFAISDNWNAVFGAENEDSSLRTASPTEFTPNPVPLDSNIEITSVYAQINGEIVKGLTLTGGLRHDDHDTFGNNTLGQAAVAWAFNDGNTTLRASFGQGFKAPTLFHLYSNFGNTLLQPEDADSWDAGIEQRFADGSVVLSAIYFGRKTKNQIDFVSCTSPNPLCTPGKTGVYDNISRAKADGVELAASVSLDALTLQANYTLTNTENTSPGNANRGRKLPRRPKNAANFWADYEWAFGLSTGFGVRYVGQTFDNAANSFVLEDYALVEVRASYPVNDNVEIYGRIENLFDQAYATTRNYSTEGRGAFAGIRTKF